MPGITIYNTWTLMQVQQRFPSLPDGFWRNLFPRVVTFDTEAILFDRIETPSRKLAPFVAPNVEGRVIRGEGSVVKQFTPAYVKPKHAIDPSMIRRRTINEQIGGSLSPTARYNAAVAANLRIEKEMVDRRIDWMAAQAILYGAVTVVGEDYPAQTVDFGRDPSLDITLTSTARWDQFATAAPLDDLQSAESAAFALGNAPITNLVFGINAWASFIKNDDVLDLLDNTKRGSTSDFSRTGLNASGNFQPMGEVSSSQGGTFRLWRYNNWYTDVNESTGVTSTKYFMDPRDVVGYGEAIDGVAAYGAIQDIDAIESLGLSEAIYYPKSWKENDPSVAFTMTQSAPLPVPMNPNNTFRIRVQS